MRDPIVILPRSDVTPSRGHWALLHALREKERWRGGGRWGCGLFMSNWPSLMGEVERDEEGGERG